MVALELPTVSCRRAVLEPISASGHEPYWAVAEPLEFVENLTGVAPEQGTSVKVVWDERELRVLFDVKDRDPWATLTERDAPLYTEEVVEIFVDPFGDLLTYYEIEVNPLNAVLDLVARKSRNGLKKDFAWDCEGLQTITRRTAEGWMAEMSIPIASLVLDPIRPGVEWRVNFLRIDRPSGRQRELSAWSATGAGTFHVPARFGRLQFVD